MHNDANTFAGYEPNAAATPFTNLNENQIVEAFPHRCSLLITKVSSILGRRSCRPLDMFFVAAQWSCRPLDMLGVTGPDAAFFSSCSAKAQRSSAILFDTAQIITHSFGEGVAARFSVPNLSFQGPSQPSTPGNDARVMFRRTRDHSWRARPASPVHMWCTTGTTQRFDPPQQKGTTLNSRDPCNNIAHGCRRKADPRLNALSRQFKKFLQQQGKRIREKQSGSLLFSSIRLWEAFNSRRNCASWNFRPLCDG